MDLALRLKIAVNMFLRKFGYEIHRFGPREPGTPHDAPDFDAEDVRIWKTVAPYTMTPPERVYSLCRAVEYIIRGGIPGDFVECGVWRGGSSMAMALTLMRLGNTDRDLYLYDTYDEGWPEGSADDVSYDGIPAHDFWLQALERGETPDTWNAKFEVVREVIRSTGYPADKIHMIKGKVEDTIPGQAPHSIALLRLDTDWHSSTWHELVHLYPRLSSRGVLMLDDYGYFLGARKAVDTYFEEHKISMLLHRVDDGGYRIGVKL